MAQPSIPFGKHNGTPLPSVPTDYLRWCAENFDPQSRGELLAQIKAELHKRANNPYYARKPRKQAEPRVFKDYDNVRPPECTADWDDDDPIQNCGVCVNCIRIMQIERDMDLAIALDGE